MLLVYVGCDSKIHSEEVGNQDRKERKVNKRINEWLLVSGSTQCRPRRDNSELCLRGKEAGGFIQRLFFLVCWVSSWMLPSSGPMRHLLALHVSLRKAELTLSGHPQLLLHIMQGQGPAEIMVDMRLSLMNKNLMWFSELSWVKFLFTQSLIFVT